MQFAPLQNGLDYLEDAVDRLAGDPTPRELKYAVLHLHAGIEVLLKYRLTCQDWKLVLAADSADTTEEDFNRGSFRSIGVGEAFKRLEKCTGIQFRNSEKRDARAVEQIRNQLQHFGLTQTAMAVESRSAKALDFILNFVDEHIGNTIVLTTVDSEFLEDALARIRTKQGKIRALVNHRMRKLEPALIQVPSTWCSDCGQPAVFLEHATFADQVGVPEHDHPRCAFCGRRWTSVKDYVDDFAFSMGLDWYLAIKEGGEYPCEHCPECGEETVVWFDPATGQRQPGMTARCFSCLGEWDERCTRCSAPTTTSFQDEIPVCSDCWDRILSD